MNKKTKNILGAVLLFIILLCSASYYIYYRWSKAPAFNVGGEKQARIYIYPEMSWDDVIHEINEVTNAPYANDLKFLLNRFAKNGPIVGSYLIDVDDTTRALYNRLVYGMQSPVSLTFRSKRLPGALYKSIADQLMMDSMQVARIMNDRDLLEKVGVKDTTMAYYLLPNTYEVYWTISPEELLERMSKENKNFWTQERLDKAEAIGLTPYEVVNLAAIIQEESNKIDEYPDIAGLYLNRLRIGMRLQSDPTVKFAHQDFALRRILHRHLTIDNPYNTYQNIGLPPGPIRIPDISAIDGVLNARKHNYIYMCAKSDFSGYHEFAETYSQHMKNARKYSNELNKRGVK